MNNKELLSAIETKVAQQGNQGASELSDILRRLVKPYLSLERIKKYLYKVTFDSVPGYKELGLPIQGGCSAYVSGGKLYRNLDFRYDEAASFIVRTDSFEGMAFITGLNDGELNDELVAQLPYHVVDGINDSGIMVSTHVLFNDWGWSGVGKKSVPLTNVPFEVLSRVKSMESIEADLDGVLNNLGMTEALVRSGYLIQLLVTDGTTTYAILPPTESGQPFVLQDITDNPKMTNFRWVSSEAVTRDELQDRPTGVERFNLMPCDLDELKFTLAYESADRLSEFIGVRGTTKDSTDEELEAIYEVAREIYLSRERNGETWQTMHSVVYGDGMEQLYIQENWNTNLKN